MNTTEQKFDLEYFISKFEAIPEELWRSLEISKGGRCCALGHCGMVSFDEYTDESIGLIKVLGGIGESDWEKVTNVNDGCQSFKDFGSTPKQRVVNYLKSLRDENKTA